MYIFRNLKGLPTVCLHGRGFAQHLYHGRALVASSDSLLSISGTKINHCCYSIRQINTMRQYQRTFAACLLSIRSDWSPKDGMLTSHNKYTKRNISLASELQIIISKKRGFKKVGQKSSIDKNVICGQLSVCRNMEELAELLKHIYESTPSEHMQDILMKAIEIQSIRSSNEYRERDQPYLDYICQEVTTMIWRKLWVTDVADLGPCFRSLAILGGQSDEQMLQDIRNCLSVNQPNLSMQDIANILPYYVVNDVQDVDVLGMFSSSLLNYSYQWEMEDFSLIMYSFGKLKFYNKEVYNIFVEHLLKQGKHMEVFHIASFVSALAANKHYDARLPPLIDDLIVRRGNLLFPQIIHNFLQFYIVFGLRHPPPVLVLTKRAIQHADDFQPNELEIVPLALATLKIDEQEAFQVFKGKILEQLQHIPANDLFGILWAYTQAGKFDKKFLTTVANAAKNQLDQISSPRFAYGTWAIVSTGVANDKVQGAIVKEILDRFQRHCSESPQNTQMTTSIDKFPWVKSVFTVETFEPDKGLTAVHISLLVWALGQMRPHNDPLIQLVVDVGKQSYANLDRYHIGLLERGLRQLSLICERNTQLHTLLRNVAKLRRQMQYNLTE